MILAVMLLSQKYNIIMAKENSGVENNGSETPVENVKELYDIDYQEDLKQQ